MSIIDDIRSVKDMRQRCHACGETVFDCPGHAGLRAHLYEELGVIGATDSRIEKPTSDRRGR
jgi:hypothetical protein